MKKNNQLILLAIFTIFTIIIWIASDLYHISITSTIPEDMKQLVVPLNPTLDTKIFDELRSKKNPADFVSGHDTLSTSSPSAQLQTESITPTTGPISTDSGVAQ